MILLCFFKICRSHELFLTGPPAIDLALDISSVCRFGSNHDLATYPQLSAAVANLQAKTAEAPWCFMQAMASCMSALTRIACPCCVALAARSSADNFEGGITLKSHTGETYAGLKPISRKTVEFRARERTGKLDPGMCRGCVGGVSGVCRGCVGGVSGGVAGSPSGVPFLNKCVMLNLRWGSLWSSLCSKI